MEFKQDSPSARPQEAYRLRRGLSAGDGFSLSC